MPTDLAGKFWDLSNAIVAFSVLQMIAFLYALARQDFRDAVANMYQPVRRAIATSCLLYSGGVIACCFAEIRSLPSAVGDAHSLRWLTCIIRVWSFCCTLASQSESFVTATTTTGTRNPTHLSLGMERIQWRATRAKSEKSPATTRPLPLKIAAAFALHVANVKLR
jgi:hypothetical protein